MGKDLLSPDRFAPRCVRTTALDRSFRGKGGPRNRNREDHLGCGAFQSFCESIARHRKLTHPPSFHPNPFLIPVDLIPPRKMPRGILWSTLWTDWSARFAYWVGYSGGRFALAQDLILRGGARSCKRESLR